MGHLINPISFRLSVNSFWNSNWILINNFNYINIFKKDFTLFHFLNWFLKKSELIEYNIIISHYKIYRINNLIYINLFYYNAHEEAQSSKLKWKPRYRRKKNKFYKLNSIEFFEYFYRTILYYLYWNLIISATTFYFQKLNNNKDIFFFNIYNLTFADITVDSITKYISVKLQKKFSLKWILSPILRDLATRIKIKTFLGFKLVCSGRFTRKQIATYTWYKKGSLQFNTVSSLIKYSEVRTRLKYGLCGIKLWVNYGNNNLTLRNRKLSLIYPIYTPFKYKVITNKNQPNIILFLNYWFFFFLRIIFFKNRSFSFYKKFIRIKLQILLKNLITKLKKNHKYILNNYSYDLKLITTTQVCIVFTERKLSLLMRNLLNKKVKINLIKPKNINFLFNKRKNSIIFKNIIRFKNYKKINFFRKSKNYKKFKKFYD